MRPFALTFKVPADVPWARIVPVTPLPGVASADVDPKTSATAQPVMTNVLRTLPSRDVLLTGILLRIGQLVGPSDELGPTGSLPPRIAAHTRWPGSLRVTRVPVPRRSRPSRHPVSVRSRICSGVKYAFVCSKSRSFADERDSSPVATKS
ncbi:hypothetical protein GCM10018775_48840 [Streptomyces umbrinus]|nr:hypothetical protein GCM10018775_48840 [Streptomyces umbrinus]